MKDLDSAQISPLVRLGHGKHLGLHKSYKSPCPLMGQGLSLSRSCHLCWQPPGYALYNRPTRIRSNILASQRQELTSAVAVNGSLAVSAADAAINALHWVLAQPQAVFQYIHHDLELTEDQHLQYHL